MNESKMAQDKNYFSLLPEDLYDNIFRNIDFKLLVEFCRIDKNFLQKIQRFFEIQFPEHFPHANIKQSDNWLVTYREKYKEDYTYDAEEQVTVSDEIKQELRISCNNDEVTVNFLLQALYYPGTKDLILIPFTPVQKKNFTAVKNGNFETIRQLINNKEIVSADLFLEDRRGYTLLDWAADFRNPDTSQEMLVLLFEFLNTHKSEIIPKRIAYTCFPGQKFLALERFHSLILFNSMFKLYESCYYGNNHVFDDSPDTSYDEKFKLDISLIFVPAITAGQSKESNRNEFLKAVLNNVKYDVFEYFLDDNLSDLQTFYDTEDLVENFKSFASSISSHKCILDFLQENSRYEQFVKYAILCIEYAIHPSVNDQKTFAFACQRILSVQNGANIYFGIKSNKITAISDILKYLKSKFEKNNFLWRNSLIQYLHILALNKSLPRKFYDDFGLVNLAVKLGDKLLLEKFLENGANPNSPNKMGITPMLRAINMRRDDLVFCLLNKGANPYLKNKYGVTPVIRAQQMNNIIFLSEIERHKEIAASNQFNSDQCLFHYRPGT